MTTCLSGNAGLKAQKTPLCMYISTCILCAFDRLLPVQKFCKCFIDCGIDVGYKRWAMRQWGILIVLWVFCCASLADLRCNICFQEICENQRVFTCTYPNAAKEAFFKPCLHSQMVRAYFHFHFNLSDPHLLDYPMMPPKMQFLSDFWHPNGMHFFFFVFQKIIKIANIW